MQHLLLELHADGLNNFVNYVMESNNYNMSETNDNNLHETIILSIIYYPIPD